ncbi:MAG: monovalent cation/H+ antiporter subunit D family protein [Pseudolabrys sp.]
MSGIASSLPALQIIVPLFGALAAALVRRHTLAYAITLAVSWLLPIIAGLLVWQTMTTGTISYHLGGWTPPWGIEYRIDAVNALVLFIVSAVGAVVIPYGWRSVSAEIDEDKQAWFYCMYLLCVTGLLGIAATGDLFNAFVFLEVSSLSGYVLIAMGRDRCALLAAFQYLIMGTIGATIYLIGVGLLYVVTGSLNIADIATRVVSAYAERPEAVVAALAFISVGLGLKCAIFPLHAWLPNAYAYAPNLVTAFMAATATKVAIYLLIRVTFGVFGSPLDQRTLTIILILSIGAMFFAAVIAIFERDLKRMLAYSSISQIGYITLGMGIANKAGLTGSILHLVNHAMMKGALFLALGAAIFRIGSSKLDDYAGIGRKMPWTMGAFTIAGFGLVGTPGTAGFISKWYLVIGALASGHWFIVFLIVASSLLALVYVGRVMEVVWFRDTGRLAEKASDPPLSMAVPMLVMTAAVVWFGIDATLPVDIAERAASLLLRLPQ